jgi:thymidine kinase
MQNATGFHDADENTPWAPGAVRDEATRVSVLFRQAGCWVTGTRKALNYPQDLMVSTDWNCGAPGENGFGKMPESPLTGKLELILGPMRSNKTAELLRRIETRRRFAKQWVLLLKPSADTKAAESLVESRNRNGCGRMEAVEFPSPDPWAALPILAAVEQRIGKRVECIAIDEGQFVADLFLFTKRLLEMGHDVMVSGLELDFRGMPFGEMLDLSWLVRTYAGNTTELVPYCSCGAKALYPQRLVDGKPALMRARSSWAGDFYEPRCGEHFVLPGRPH